MNTWHVGIKTPSYHADIFRSLTEVTYKTHGHLYGYCFGAYKTRKQAIMTAHYQGTPIDSIAGGNQYKPTGYKPISA